MVLVVLFLNVIRNRIMMYLGSDFQSSRYCGFLKLCAESRRNEVFSKPLDNFSIRPGDSHEGDIISRNVLQFTSHRDLWDTVSS